MWKIIYKKLIIIGVFLGCLFLIHSQSNAQGAISTKGGNQTISITTGIAGGQPISVVNTATSLSYKLNKNSIQKITVSTACPGQRFSLRVLAVSVTQGTPSVERTLINGNPALDFITEIPARAGNGQATLQYTASATYEQGNSVELGNDLHTVTYTIIEL